MVALTFPDGARRDYPPDTTGLDIAKGISPSLAKRTVAMALDGKLVDLADPIEHDAKIEFLTRDDPRALELIRHDAAHVLAEAVQTLWPGTQVTIGPVIDNGFYYDFFRNEPFTPEDFAAIEKKMREIIARDKPFTKEVWSRDKAKQVFRDKGEKFKVELVDAIPEDQELKIYKQGDWFDLCRGPHMTSTGKVGNAFKLMKVAGAYWRGDSNREMLSRIYGTAFAKQEELDAYLKQIEEAEKRDHRKLGREMDLFHFQEEAPGSVFWHPKGWTLFQTLENYIRRRQADAGYAEVNAPQLIDSSLWVASGHMATFRDSMFLVQPREEDERTFVIKPMNCPGHIQIFKNGLKSYRDLPFKIAEFGKVHRFEPSGALHGLMRVRAFTQDDAHIFITEEQIAAEVLKVNDLILSIYQDFGFDDVRIKFSDRPDKRIGDDAVWDKAEAALMQALEASGRPWTLNKGEGAFYGPKLEYVLRDAIGRDWQCGTVQVDLNMPGRLGAFYIDEHSNKVTPVMLHRAMFGSLERFTGIMIEHYAGHLPLWLSPLQAVVATITSDADDYARDAIAAARRLGLRVEGDLRNEKINYKVREHSLAKVPALLVVGKKEAAERTVSIRRLGSEKQQTMPLDCRACGARRRRRCRRTWRGWQRRRDPGAARRLWRCRVFRPSRIGASVELDQPGVVDRLHALTFRPIKKRHAVEAGAVPANLNRLALDKRRDDVGAVEKTNDFPCEIPVRPHFRTGAIEQKEVGLATRGERANFLSQQHCVGAALGCRVHPSPAAAASEVIARNPEGDALTGFGGVDHAQAVVAGGVRAEADADAASHVVESRRDRVTFPHGGYRIVGNRRIAHAKQFHLGPGTSGSHGLSVSYDPAHRGRSVFDRPASRRFDRGMNFQGVFVGVKIWNRMSRSRQNLANSLIMSPEFDCTVPQAREGETRGNPAQSATCCSATRSAASMS